MFFLNVNKNNIIDEGSNRANLGRYLIITTFGLCVYTFSLDYIEVMYKSAEATSYLAFGLLFFVVACAVYLVLNSGYPLSQFGLTIKNWQRTVSESIVFTIPILVLITLIKWLATKFISTYHNIPLFDLHGGVVHTRLVGTSKGTIIWFETMFLYACIIAPLQEWVVRGIYQGGLSMFLNNKHRHLIAIIVTNMVFSTVHLMYSISIVELSFIGGLFWGWLFYRQKTILGVSISHAMIGVWIFWFLGIT